MRILYYNPTGVIGGGERMLLSVITEVRQAAPTAQLYLVLGADGLLRERAANLGVDTLVLPFPRGLSGLGDSSLKEGRGQGRWKFLARAALAVPAVGFYVRRLRNLIRRLAPDVVHANGIKANLLAALAAPRDLPVLWHVQDFYGARLLVRRLLAVPGRRAAAAIALSRAVAQDLQTLLPRLPIHVIYNATDVERFCPGPGDGAWLDAQVGLLPGETPSLRVGLVATYARWKGQDVFLEAAAQVVRRLGPQVIRFYIVGGPIYQTTGSQFSPGELQSQARKLGIERQVGFVPFQADPADCYRALDVVVHASTRPEPFGLTIVEAMACGRAVIAARAGGAAELFQSGSDALGAAPGDPMALAEAIAQLARDSDLRRQLGVRARATAVARFDQRRLGEELREVYAGLVPAAGISGPGMARSMPAGVL